ncbi:MAG: 2-oxoglutarate ferredoxin oxidoreductase subunit gamma [Clostridia bacterium]|jgi:2-oxoglutarate ferredoxin oxidoreductase subunit gamma|nr:pyruvate ferredoxin/flavodoxin oxidoreductase [Clostridiales bacterium]MDK2984570.1 2-oxoglutarate ferredoxin oxidoreductase subunit gamma [Clostridia bacterium]
MEEKMVFAGFGGQGVLFMGKLLAHAGMLAGKNVTWIPSYGPEMRGGTANCSVIISDNRIGSPTVDEPTIAVVMNGASFDKFVDKVKPDGDLFVNSSIVDRTTDRNDINIIKINANDLAYDNFQTSKLANVIVLGHLLAKKNILNKEIIFKAIDEMVGEKRPEMVEINKRAIELGMSV